MHKINTNSQDSILSSLIYTAKTKVRPNFQFSILNFQFLLLILHCSLFILTSSCSRTTSSEQGNLSGSIALTNDTGNPDFDTNDFSGVTAAIYKAITLDPVIAELNTAYPNVGVQIGQETEFDHRLVNPVKTTLTAADGSFSFRNLPVGRYNLVLMKESWGIRYLCDIEIEAGDNTLSEKNQNSANFQFSILKSQLDKSVIPLYPETQLAGFVSESFEFKSGHSYLITENTDFTSGVILSPNSLVWVEPAKTLAFYSVITTPVTGSGFTRLTTADGRFTTTALSEQSIQRFYAVDCTSFAGFSSGRLSSVITTYTELGWNIQSGNLDITNMIIRQAGIALQFTNRDNISLSNCNILNSGDPEQGAVSFIGCDTLQTTGVIIMDCPTGISQKTCKNANIDNSYFNNNSMMGINNWYETTGSITHCTFINSGTAISTSGKSNTTIEYCDIKAYNGIHNTSQTNWFWSHFTAHNNNLDCSGYAMQTTAVFYTADTIHHSATGNYWKTTNTAEIDSLIWDLADYEGNPDYPDWPIVAVIDYQPIKFSRVPNAGVY